MKCQTCQGKGYVNGEKCNCWYRSGEHSVHPCEDCHSTPTEKMIAIPKKGKISFRIKDGVQEILSVDSTPTEPAEAKDWEKEIVKRFFVYNLGGTNKDHVGAEKDLVEFVRVLLSDQEAKAKAEMQATLERVRERIEDIRIDMAGSACDCGEELKDTDAYNLVLEALAALKGEGKV